MDAAPGLAQAASFFCRPDLSLLSLLSQVAPLHWKVHHVAMLPQPRLGPPRAQVSHGSRPQAPGCCCPPSCSSCCLDASTLPVSRQALAYGTAITPAATLSLRSIHVRGALQPPRCSSHSICLESARQTCGCHCQQGPPASLGTGCSSCISSGCGHFSLFSLRLLGVTAA